MACLILAVGVSAEPKTLDLTWDQLVPEGSGGPDYTRVSPVLQIVKSLMSGDAEPPPVVASLDGRGVRLSGYVVPLKHEGMRVRLSSIAIRLGPRLVPPPPVRRQTPTACPANRFDKTLPVRLVSLPI
jgi:hypothetical protein